MKMTWNEFKKQVDEFLNKEGRTGEIDLACIRFDRTASTKNYMDLSNKNRGPEECLQVWNK